jgi:hypothetical protein
MVAGCNGSPYKFSLGQVMRGLFLALRGRLPGSLVRPARKRRASGMDSNRRANSPLAVVLFKKMERETGIEPATSSLGNRLSIDSTEFVVVMAVPFRLCKCTKFP